MQPLSSDSVHFDSKASRLRRELKAFLTQECLAIAPFCWDALTARMAELAGARTVFMSGFGVCTSLCLPDIGVVTLQEMVLRAKQITSAIDVPLIVDADDGYGGFANVKRTVEEFEQAGVAALQIEDQPFPKVSGLMQGKVVLPIGVAVRRIEFALRARRDDNLLLIARTDAMESEGFEAAVARARAFASAGADLVLVTEVPRSSLERLSEALAGHRCVYLGPQLTPHEQNSLGFALQLCSAPMRPAWMAYYDQVAALLPSAAKPVTGVSNMIAQITRVADFESHMKDRQAP